MNYVGSISVLDRGDGPAQAILDKNARSLAERVATETKEELEEVLNRVDNIYGNFEMTEQMYQKGKVGKLEYMDSLSELEEILRDSIKKKKYQHQLTIFIVGYENVCGQKLKLLQQVNEFFMDNSHKFDEESINPKPQSPEINMEDAGKAVEESLNVANELTNKLDDINKEMVDYLTSYAHNKASNKGRKKLEKALAIAKEDITSLSEKLMQAQQDLEDREDKMQQMFKQVEIKNMEIQKYKTAAEVAKRSSGDTDSIREEMELKDSQINQMKKRIEGLELDLAQKEHSREQTQVKLKNATVDSTSKVRDLQEQVQTLELESATEKREFQRFHDEQIEAMHGQHREEIDRLNNEHGEEIKKLMNEVQDTKTQLMHAEFRTNELTLTHKKLSEAEAKLVKAEEKNKDLEFAKQQIAHLKDELVEKQLAEEELRAATRDSSRQDNVSRQLVRETPPKKKSATVIKQNPAKPSSTKSTRSVRETSDASIQDEGGNPDTAITESRRSTKLESVDEADANFVDEFELEDEDAWMSVPKKQLNGRFKQYRKLSRLKIKELEDKLNITQSRTTKKVTTLKAQFQEHKKKWEQERNLLIEQVEQAQKLQMEAEKEADSAMTQLEDFIVEQENLEKEEDDKRKEVQRRQKPAISLEDAQASLESALQQNASSEKELSQLLQQTDDAKSQRIQSSASSHAVSDAVLLRMTSSSGTTDVVAEGTPPRVGTNTSLQPPDSRLSSRQQAAGSPSKPSSVVGASEPAEPQPEAAEEEAADLSQRLGDAGKLSAAANEQTTLSVHGNTEEEIRISSAASRSSLRSKYKSTLGEKRAAFDGRRSKSPAISIQSQASFHEAVLDENGDIPYPDDMKEMKTMEIGTSPPPGLKSRETSFVKPRQGFHILAHPITVSYLECYDKMVSFKDDISKALMDKEMMSLSQVLTELETVSLHKEDLITPQIEEMTINTYHILDEVSSLVSSILATEREYPVSSLMTMSRGQTRGLQTREKSVDTPLNEDSMLESRRSVALSAKSYNSKGSDFVNLKELQEQFDLMQNDYADETKKNQEELNRNAVMMMEMQQTIQHMQREYNALHTKYVQAQPPEEPADASVMFTRLDSDRNAKMLKKAVMDDRLEPEKYKDAVETMEKYISLPAKRLHQLVRKYVHHCQMKKIEENVRNSRSLNDDVFTTLDHMEALQNARARRWAEEMDGMGEERLRLAHELMDTLDSLEQESGIFLVKPMFSYRGRVHMDKYMGRLPRKYKQAASIARMGERSAPLPTPSANMPRTVYQNQRIAGDIDSMENFASQVETDPEITGAAMNWIGNRPGPMWNMNTSVSRALGGDSAYLQSSMMNTPRILELDVNRMMIGQNNVSSKTAGLSEDRLVNAAQTNLRSYMTVNRPSVNRLPNQQDRPNSGPEEKRRNTTPMFSPHPPASASTERNHLRGRSFDEEAMKTFSSTPPLPPITPSNNNRPHSTPLHHTEQDPPLPPRSPPGSSLRQSPPPLDLETPQPVSKITTMFSTNPSNLTDHQEE